MNSPKRPPAWLKKLWEFGSIVGAAAVVLFSALLLLSVGSWLDSANRALDLTGTALASADETLDLVGTTLGILDGTGGQLALSLDRAGGTIDAVARVADDTAILLADDLPADLDAIRTSLDGLIDTANVVDGVLGALAFVGLDYDPAVPLDEALIELDQRIAALPQRLRAQASSLDEVSGGMADLATDADALADDLVELQNAVVEARELVDTYRNTAREGSESLALTSGHLASAGPLIRWAIVTLAFVALLAMSAVWWLSRSGSVAPSIPHTE